MKRKPKHSTIRNIKQKGKKGSIIPENQIRIFVADTYRQLFRLKTILLICCIFSLVMIGIVFLISKGTGLRFSYLSRDMAAVCNVKAYIGFLSNMGIILWSAAVGINFFTAILFRKNRKEKNIFGFFICAGFLTLLLALDDVLLFHDRIFPEYLQIPEYLVHSSYACMTIAWFIIFSKIILSTDFLILFISLGLLAASMFADQFTQFSEIENIIEDSLKFTGITFWLAYFVQSGSHKIKKFI